MILISSKLYLHVSKFGFLTIIQRLETIHALKDPQFPRKKKVLPESQSVNQAYYKKYLEDPP